MIIENVEQLKRLDKAINIKLSGQDLVDLLKGKELVNMEGAMLYNLSIELV